MTAPISEVSKLKLERAGFANLSDQPLAARVAGHIEEQQKIFATAIQSLGFVSVPKSEQTPVGLNTYRACEITSACATTHKIGILDYLQEVAAAVRKPQSRNL